MTLEDESFLVWKTPENLPPLVGTNDGEESSRRVFLLLPNKLLNHCTLDWVMQQ